MGCFDSVMIACPHCGSITEVQSKAGRCTMRNYHGAAVPIEIAVALNDTADVCAHCNQPFVIHAATPRYVALYVSRAVPDEGGDDYVDEETDRPVARNPRSGWWELL